MSQTAKRHSVSDAERYQAVTTARERFLAGDDRSAGSGPKSPRRGIAAASSTTSTRA